MQALTEWMLHALQPVSGGARKCRACVVSGPVGSGRNTIVRIIAEVSPLLLLLTAFPSAYA